MARKLQLLDKDNLTIVDVILAAIPFSDELVEWVQTHPHFKAGLKFSNEDYFLPLGLILTSTSPKRPSDKIIGFVVWDKVKRIFKQDYIVNVGSRNDEFILYSKIPGKLDTPETRHIKRLYALYEVDPLHGYEVKHHLGLADIDLIAQSLKTPWLSDMARRMMQIGDSQVGSPTQKQLQEVYKKIVEARENGTLTD